MPIYEYECCKCHSRFEKKQRFYDEVVEACPKCQGKSKRVLSPVSVVFKGSGFYVNDYRKDKPENSAAKPAEKVAEKAKEKTPEKKEKVA